MEEIEGMISQFRSAQEFNAALNDYLNDNLKFGDKSPKEWKKYFRVKIPDEITFPVLIKLAAEIFEKYQIAAMLRDKETIQLTIIEQSRIDKYNMAYQQAQDESRQKFKKNLAAKSCEIAADLATKDIEDAISHQKIAKDFWKGTCDTLTELRKLLESMGYALSNDVRVNRDFNIRGEKGK